MNYVTTNIRLPEEDYMRLKQEAAQARKSFAAIVREKIIRDEPKEPTTDMKIFLRDRNEVAKKLRKKLQAVDIVKVLREMRYKGKW